jgi:heme/copper-type cytochrome/quinol oxidase subunit 2
MAFTKDSIPDALSWLLSVFELLIVLGISVLVGYTVVCFLWTARQTQAAQIAHMMEVVHANWKAALILLIPLLYRPARTFLENLEEAGSWKRRKLISPETKQEESNPTPEHTDASGHHQT